MRMYMYVPLYIYIGTDKGWLYSRVQVRHNQKEEGVRKDEEK